MELTQKRIDKMIEIEDMEFNSINEVRTTLEEYGFSGSEYEIEMNSSMNIKDCTFMVSFYALIENDDDLPEFMKN